MTGRSRDLLGRLAALLVLSGALISAGPAFGQGAADQTNDQTAQNTTGQSGTATGTLQEVVVTAERRAENIQTTPISVIAISGADLQAASVASVNDLQAVAPDLDVTSGGGVTDLNIRGIGITPVGADEVAGVVVVRDGVVNNTAGYGLDMPFYDMADVEVLRGPQGTFQGDNSTGGAITINSQNPNFRGINGYVTTKVGTYSDTGLQGAVNLPVTDTLAMRLAFNEEQRGSFFYDEGAAYDGPNEDGPLFTRVSPTCPSNTEAPTAPCASSGDTNKTSIDPGNVNQKDIRLGLLWKPSDNFQSLTKIEIDNNDTDGLPDQPDTATYAPLPGQPCPAGAGTAPHCVTLYTFPGYSGSPYVLNSWNTAGLWDEDISMYSDELRYTLPSGTVARLMLGDTEIGINQVGNQSTSDSIDIQDGQNDSALNQGHNYNTEIDLISPTTGKLSWVAGAAWVYTANQFASYSIDTSPLSGFSDPGEGLGPEYVFWTNGETIYAKSEGIFGQLTWQINPTLQFQVGGRLGWDRDTGKGDLEILFPTGFAPSFVFPIVPLTGGGTGQEFPLQAIGASYDGKVLEAADNAVPTGKIGLNWTPVTGQYFYVFWARGYKPGLQNLGTAPPTTKEFVNDSELGWKGTFAGGHVLTQLGGYYMQYYQMIESIFNPYNVEGTSDANIPYSSIRGLEASMQTQVGGFGFDISADYNKSVLGAVTTAATYAFPATFGHTDQCTAATGPPLPGNSNCTDYKGVFTGVNYMQNLSGEELPYSPLFQGNATIKYSIPLGNMSLQPRVTYSYISKSYASLFDINYYELPAHSLVNAYVDWIAGPWTATLFATNVANTLYLTNQGGFGTYYGNPRQLGLTVTRTF